MIVFTFRNMPVAIESGTTTLLQIDNSIEEASTILGADSGYSFRRITLPMLQNAFFSGIVYSFTKAITAVSAVIFLVSPRWKLVTSNIYSLFDLAKYGQAAAFVTMMVGILLVFIGMFNTVINLLLAPRSKVPQAQSKNGGIKMSQEKNEKLGFSKKSSGVVLKDVTKIFQQPDTGKDFVAVDHINLEIKDGEMVTLLGPSGCGKTTTLRMISGFEYPTSGNVFIGDRDVAKIPPNKRGISMVFQSYACSPT